MMDFVIDFLVGNYMWFLVITIVLIFALIGYVVDSKEHKEVSIFDSPQELAKNLEMLAASAQNKTIGEAMNPNNQNFQVSMGPVNNTITENTGYQQQSTYVNTAPTNFVSTSPVNNNPVNMGTNFNSQGQINMGQNIQNSNGMNSNPNFEVFNK